MHRRNLKIGFLTLAALIVTTVAVAAQSNPRFGVWQMQSENPPPYKNIMTYEPYGNGGMEITVASTNAQGQDNEWGYATMFDGIFREVRGQEGSATAVEVIDERSTRISNRRDGHVYQVIVNTLSEDGNTIENEYVRFDENSKVTSVGHATYKRIR